METLQLTKAPRLPPEMTDYVIDYLHDSKQSLASCALVSRSFIPCSRFHLFHSLCCGPGEKNSYVYIATYFQEHPHLQSYVRDIRLAAYPPYQRHFHPKVCRCLLIDILHKLPHLSSLTISAAKLGCTRYCRALSHSRPQFAPISLTQLTLIGVNSCRKTGFPAVVKFFNMFHHIDHLHLQDTGVSCRHFPQEETLQMIEQAGKQLSWALEINNMQVVARYQPLAALHLFTKVGAMSLDTLTFKCNIWEDWYGLTDIIEQSASTLRDLTLDVGWLIRHIVRHDLAIASDDSDGR